MRNLCFRTGNGAIYTPFLDPTRASKRGFPFWSRFFQSRRATQVYIGEVCQIDTREQPLVPTTTGATRSPIQRRLVNPTNPRFPAPPHRLQYPACPSPAPRSKHFPRNTNLNSNSPQDVLESLRHHAELPLSCPVRAQSYTVRYRGMVEVSNHTTTLLVVVAS